MIKRAQETWKSLRCDEGAALMTVMMLVAVISVMLVAFVDLNVITFRKLASSKMMAQADHYAFAGEILGREKAVEFKKNAAFLALVGADTSQRTIIFPIDGGTIEGSLQEASNCLNIASILSHLDDGVPASTSDQPAAIFYRLLGQFGIQGAGAVALTAALVDWQDADGTIGPRGAEDGSYSRRNTPYLAANAPMTDLSELVLVEGFTPDLVAVLAPHICVREATVPTVVNLNTMDISNAPLLAAIIGHGVTVQDASQLLASKPVMGYDYIGDFWLQSLLKDREIPQTIRALVDTETHYFQVMVDVSYYDMRRRLTSVVHVSPDGASRVISRKFGQ